MATLDHDSLHRASALLAQSHQGEVGRGMAMAKHQCPRCGFESSRDRWRDLHPFLAVLFALPAGYTLVGVMLVYPWFTIPVTTIVCAVAVYLLLRRRAALVARADWEHHDLIARAVFQPPSSLPAPAPPARRPLIRRRPADHRSRTERLPEQR